MSYKDITFCLGSRCPFGGYCARWSKNIKIDLSESGHKVISMSDFSLLDGQVVEKVEDCDWYIEPDRGLKNVKTRT